MSSTPPKFEDFFDVFVPEQYICSKCNELLKDAVQTNCGHFLCEDCAGELFFIQKKHTRCPRKSCNEKLMGEDGTKYFPDRHLRREIEELPANCRVNICNWNGRYKDCKKHLQCHPPTVWQAIPKRKATHVLLDIKEQGDVIITTPQQLRETAQQMHQSANNLLEQADSLERCSKGAEYVARASADSLRKNQAETGAEASSNKSLTRASELGAFPGTCANTLDAAVLFKEKLLTWHIRKGMWLPEVSAQQQQLTDLLHRQVHLGNNNPSVIRNSEVSALQGFYLKVLFETMPELETTENFPATVEPEAQRSRCTQMVPGMTCTSKHRHLEVNLATPPPLQPKTSTPNKHASSATAKAQSPSRRSRMRPPPLSLIVPSKSAQPNTPTLSPVSPRQHIAATQQSKSPTTHLPPLSSKAPIQVTKQSSQATPFLTKAPPPPLITTPTIIPPPRILQTKKLPISHTSILPSPCVETKKPNTLPQVTQGHKCTNTDCKRKIKALTAVAQELIITCSVCPNCHKNKKFRSRFQSI